MEKIVLDNNDSMGVTFYTGYNIGDEVALIMKDGILSLVKTGELPGYDSVEIESENIIKKGYLQIAKENNVYYILIEEEIIALVCSFYRAGSHYHPYVLVELKELEKYGTVHYQLVKLIYNLYRG